MAVGKRSLAVIQRLNRLQPNTLQQQMHVLLEIAVMQAVHMLLSFYVVAGVFQFWLPKQVNSAWPSLYG